MKAFGSLIEEKVEPEDSVMKGVTMRPIDTEDVCATGSFLEIGDVVFGKLLAQIDTDHVKLGQIAHVLFGAFPDISCSKRHHDWFLSRRSRSVISQPSIRHRFCRSQEVRTSSWFPSRSAEKTPAS